MKQIEFVSWLIIAGVIGVLAYASTLNKRYKKTNKQKYTSKVYAYMWRVGICACMIGCVCIGVGRGFGSLLATILGLGFLIVSAIFMCLGEHDKSTALQKKRKEQNASEKEDAEEGKKDENKRKFALKNGCKLPIDFIYSFLVNEEGIIKNVDKNTLSSYIMYADFHDLEYKKNCKLKFYRIIGIIADNCFLEPSKYKKQCAELLYTTTTSFNKGHAKENDLANNFGKKLRRAIEEDDE